MAEESGGRQALLAAVVHSPSTPCFVINSRHEVQMANDAAERALARCGEPRGRRRRLAQTAPGAVKKLAAAIAARDPIDWLIAQQAQGAPLIALVSAITGAHAETCFAIHIFDGEDKRQGRFRRVRRKPNG